ncbi:MAG TPA: cytochrome c biogenesis protein CcdA [Blastocatellia bacterium]|nr:cytochrome c biogenesis protein CcdA [Blastocatellia bacterium]
MNMIRTRGTRLGFALLVVISLAALAFAQGSDRVVKARGVVSVDGVRPGDKFKVAVALEIAEGYHINAHVPSLDYLVATDVKFEPVAGLRLSEPMYPSAKQRAFVFSPETPLAVHEGTAVITANVEADGSVQPGPVTLRASVQVQACNDSQCLAPATVNVEIPIKVVAAGTQVNEVNSQVFASLVQFGGARDANAISDLIASSGLLVALLSIFVSGLALNLTPCVYPIIPITIGFFMNQSQRGGSSRLRRTFAMAGMYVIGMAITYSVLGVAASLTKGLFGGALQNPFVLVGLALLMVALALSMFGFWEFKVPEFLNRFANKSTQSTSGVVGALVMGLTMGIVAAPCIGPFVLALLVHVGAKGEPIYGFFMFFVLALGLGTPYLILGTFSGALKSLPRSGEWMVTVRKVFGVVLVGMALYFLMPLMGKYTNYVFVGFFALASLYLIFWEPSRTKSRTFAWMLRGIGIGAAVLAVSCAVPRRAESGITWQPYSEKALAAAQSEGKGVIIDSFADWCIPCKELDQATFTDRNVKKEAERFVTLKLDLTSNDPNSDAGRARERFNILGVPTIIFIDAEGRERSDLRLEGFEKPSLFAARMKRIESPLAGGEASASAAANGSTSPPTDGASIASEPLLSGPLTLLDGKQFDFASLQGKVVIVDLWATWCVPCLSEIPMFNRLQRRYEKRGFDVVAVSMDEEGAAVVKPFLRKYPMSYTVAIAGQKGADALNAQGSSLPIALVVDQQGRVRFRHVGITSEETLEETFKAEIEQLLAR